MIHTPGRWGTESRRCARGRWETESRRRARGRQWGMESRRCAHGRGGMDSRRCAVLATGILLFATVGSASAQTPPDARQIAAAQALYDAAVADLARGDTASACPKLEEVTAIEPAGIGARLTLASCYERASRLASAWVTYKLAEAEAARQGQSERKERAAAAAQSLAPKLAHLTIEIPADVRSLEAIGVLRDGAKVGASQWNEPLPVDSGIHTVNVTAPGRAPWSRTVTVADGETAVVTVPPLSPTGSPPAAPSATATLVTGALAPKPSASVALSSPSSRLPAPFWDTPRVLGAAASVFGALSFTAAAVSLGVAVDRKAASDPHCSREGLCDPVGFPVRAEAFTAGNMATAFCVTGAVTLTGGLVLGFFWPRARPKLALSTGTLEIVF